jgi:rhodanese-related sulfurtransferase
MARGHPLAGNDLLGACVKFVIDNIFLVAIALVSGVMLIWPLLRRGAGGASVNTLEATQMINRQDALMLDVREQAEYAQAHILNARGLPLSQLEARIGDLEKFKDKPLIVYCATDNRSSTAVATLKKRGFTNVFSLSGGFSAWQSAGLPVQK